MLTLWGELSAAETGQHLSFLRQPDLGFAWTVHAWARGTALEKLVGSDLTAGDFVRSMKQLIDLLGVEDAITPESAAIGDSVASGPVQLALL